VTEPKLKVLVCMEPLVGGSLRHLEHIVAHTPLDAHEVHLAVSAERDKGIYPQLAEWEDAGFTIHEVPMVRTIRTPWRDWRALRRLTRLMKDLQPDVVHTHVAKAGFLGRLAAHRCGIPTMHTPHGFPFRRGRRFPHYLMLQRVAARWTDHYVLLCDYQVHQVLRHRMAPVERTTVIPNGVDETVFGQMSRSEARRELGLDQDAPIVLCLGRLSPLKDKGQDVLLDAAAILAREGEPTQFLIVGGGAWEPELSQRILSEGLRDTVELTGPTSRPELYYTACDVVAMPSRFEAFPYVILEGQASGRAIVSSLVSGMAEMVSHGEDGYLVAPESGEALAAALRGLAGRRAALDAMGQRGRARKRLSPAECVHAINALWARVASEKKRRKRD
jgi:glycosyltransferase involved in cell wall biosynthesis